MELSGWIKLHRKLLNTSWHNKPNVMALAIYCLLKAYWEPGKVLWGYSERLLKPGQFRTGTNSLKRETGLTRSQLRTSLKILSTTEFLTNESTNLGSIITVLKYSDYQISEKDQPTESPTLDQPIANLSPTYRQPLTTNEEVKKLRSKEVKEKTLNPLCDKIFELLETKVKNHRPNHKPGNKEKDLKIIDQLIRLDNREPNRLIELLNWYPIGQEYMPEIFSAQALREKYDKLETAFQRSQKKVQGGYDAQATIQRMEEKARYVKETKEAAKRLFGG